MTEKELEKAIVIQRAMPQWIGVSEADEAFNSSERQVYRLKTGFK